MKTKDQLLVDAPVLEVKKYKLGFRRLRLTKVCSGVFGEGEYPVVHNFDAKTDTLNKFILKEKGKFTLTPLMKTSRCA